MEKSQSPMPTIPSPTATLFNATLPTFRTPTDDIYNRLLPAILLQEDHHLQNLRPDYTPTPEEQTLIHRAAILRTAYEQIPALDLVLTPTGFGIVSNQQTAPASPARVSALREQVRRSATLAEDTLLQHFLHSAPTALLDPASHCPSLIYSPTIAQAFGIQTPDGRTIYHEEFPRVIPTIHEAQARLSDLISPELLTALIRHQYQADTDTTTDRLQVLDLLLYHARHLIAALCQREAPTSIQLLQRHLLSALRANAALLPEYTNSRTYLAQTSTPYANQRQDPSFFFS